MVDFVGVDALPAGLALDLGDLVEGLAEAHDAEADHARVEAEHAPQLRLRATPRVEPHDEVVPLGVLHLVHARRPRQQEGAPVGVPAHDAAGSQHEGAGRAGDPAIVEGPVRFQREWYEGGLGHPSCGGSVASIEVGDELTL